MVHATAAIRIPKSITDVWRAYADFGAVQEWSPLVARSYLTSQLHEGVGTARHCDLVPRGAVEETITRWEPEARLVVSVEPAGPIAAQQVTFELADDSDETTVRMTVEIQLQPEAEDRAAQLTDTFRTVLRSTLAGLRHHLVTGESVDGTTPLTEDGLSN